VVLPALVLTLAAVVPSESIHGLWTVYGRKTNYKTSGMDGAARAWITVAKAVILATALVAMLALRPFAPAPVRPPPFILLHASLPPLHPLQSRSLSILVVGVPKVPLVTSTVKARSSVIAVVSMVTGE
jgi:hypothetical protein